MITRRQFLKLSTIAGTGMVLMPGLISLSDLDTKKAYAFNLNANPGLRKFAQPLRGVGPAGIPVAVKDGIREYNDILADHYSINIIQYTDQLHPHLPPTTLWGYNPTKALGVTGEVRPRHLGGIIIAEKGRPIQITFKNNLRDPLTKKPLKHILPVDTSIMGAEGAQNRTTVHFHGGEVPWLSDGGPFTWFDSEGNYGESIIDKKGRNLYKVINPHLKPGEAEYYYPINQSARFGWYHDHAVGITRLNAYAEIASALLIRDNFERSLIGRGLPDFIEKGGREIPIIIQEKVFLHADDPNFPGSAKTKGSLWYPYKYHSEAAPDTHPENLPLSAVPEFFGDTMLVNGVVWPQATVEPRRYRLRVLNATQARFLNLQLYVANQSGDLPDFTKPGPDFLVIGTEGGFLARPAVVKTGNRIKTLPQEIDPSTGQPIADRSVDAAKPGGSLLTAPAERFDIIIDFKGFEGKKLILYNDAPAPFPMGSADNDGPAVEVSVHGKIEKIFTNQMMMRFDVGTSVTAPADPPLNITPALKLATDPKSGIDPSLVGKWTTQPSTLPLTDLPQGVKISKVRQLTLNEIFDQEGRLIQMLGTNQTQALPTNFSLPDQTPGGPKTFAQEYIAPTTEDPQVGTVEVWQIANLTADTHPMHFHLVNVQLLSRQPFTDYLTNTSGVGSPTGLGIARGPEPTELGWKDTVKMHPGEVTTIIMRFDLQPVPFVVPPSPRTGGNEYVWHCHILEHEEHDMMRPLVVRGANPVIDE